MPEYDKNKIITRNYGKYGGNFLILRNFEGKKSDFTKWTYFTKYERLAVLPAEICHFIALRLLYFDLYGRKLIDIKKETN